MLINPILATHYNPKQVRISDVIIPPYDAIAKEKVSGFLSKSPYNFAHVILPRDSDPNYAAATQRLSDWKRTGVLQQDTAPSYYLYRQEFALDNKHHTRDTLMCAVKLHPFSDGVIRPHENTFQKYRSDRLNILRSTHYQLSHIFGMVKDPAGELSQLFESCSFQEPLLKGTDDDGVKHTLWRADAHVFQKRLNALFEDRCIYIVDGHHRYSSALEYAREMGVLGSDLPAAQMLFCIANVFDPALIVFPTHRQVHRLSIAHDQLKGEAAHYRQDRLTPDGLFQFVQSKSTQPSFAVYQNGQLALWTPNNMQSQAANWGNSVSKLSVAWSDWKLLASIGVNDSNRSETVHYERDITVAWENRDRFALCVFHNSTPVELVCNVADEKCFMPQKTTYFYPKLAAGLVMRSV